MFAKRVLRTVVIMIFLADLFAPRSSISRDQRKIVQRRFPTNAPRISQFMLSKSDRSNVWTPEVVEFAMDIRARVRAAEATIGRAVYTFEDICERVTLGVCLVRPINPARLHSLL